MKYAVSQMKREFGNRLKESVQLAAMTTLKIGGPADYFIAAESFDEMGRIVSSAMEAGIPFVIFGGGSNVLVSDTGFRGLVIKNNSKRIAIAGAKGKREEGINSGTVFVEADSGVLINTLVRYAVDEGLIGLEMHLGLPGTVGGAIYMNSKWTHPVGYVGDCVYQAEIITSEGVRRIVPRSYFHFGYDYSSLQKVHDVVLRVVFSLQTGTKELLWRTANESIEYRRKTQPQGVSSPGCTFRNISMGHALIIPTPNHTQSAGFLLEKAGLKGFRIGGAQISPVHANFIINADHATASDVIRLIAYAKEKVRRAFGVELEEEIVRIGEF